jgi:hypothetical protein
MGYQNLAQPLQHPTSKPYPDPFKIAAELDPESVQEPPGPIDLVGLGEEPKRILNDPSIQKAIDAGKKAGLGTTIGRMAVKTVVNALLGTVPLVGAINAAASIFGVSAGDIVANYTFGDKNAQETQARPDLEELGMGETPDTAYQNDRPAGSDLFRNNGERQAFYDRFRERMRAAVAPTAPTFTGPPQPQWEYPQYSIYQPT